MSPFFLRLTAVVLATGALSAAVEQTPARPAAPIRTAADSSSVAPRTPATIRTVNVAMIQGNALDSGDGPLPNATVRLRDARYGRIVDTQLTDNSGMFVFRALDPGTYIVEMISVDSTVLAASEILYIDAGQSRSALVKLPSRVTGLAGLFGGGNMSTAAVIVTEAVANGLVAVIATNPVSPVE
jgi:hypothetical protein